MDQLTDELRRLDPPPPPSRVDLDAIVRRAHRHRARTRLLVAVAAAAVVAGAALPLVVDRHRDGGAAAQPTVTCVPTGETSGPRPGTEREAAAERLHFATATRLSMVLDGPLRQALPGAILLDAATCRPELTFRGAGERFDLGIVVVDAAGSGRVDVRVAREAAPAGRDCNAGTETTTCEWATLPDGTVTFRSRADHGGGVVWYDADVYRPDGVHVHLSADNVAFGGTGDPTRVIPPLDDAALLRLTRVESLTL
ncbi:hypothetical protein [Dactylosporangium sp. NPDC000521]|uniref:hypothetical protein n=1 Tax=Dactylosporangium sp. NPDC000521 TaxID=3363975 RepID=UPI0036C47462